MNAAAPVLADDGERALIAGTGLGVGPGGWYADEPPQPDRPARMIGNVITALTTLILTSSWQGFGRCLSVSMVDYAVESVCHAAPLMNGVL